MYRPIDGNEDRLYLRSRNHFRSFLMHSPSADAVSDDMDAEHLFRHSGRAYKIMPRRRTWLRVLDRKKSPGERGLARRRDVRLNIKTDGHCGRYSSPVAFRAPNCILCIAAFEFDYVARSHISGHPSRGCEMIVDDSVNTNRPGLPAYERGRSLATPCGCIPIDLENLTHLSAVRPADA